MSGPTLVPPGHQAIKVLRRVEGERLVVHTRRTTAGAGDCATLVLLEPVPLHFGSTLSGVILRGRGSIEGLPAEVSRTLEGFRVRARVPEDETGIVQVVDAGVLQVREGEGLDEALPPPGHGYVWASTGWVPGETLDKAWPHLGPRERASTLQQVAANLATLHRFGIFYGDLKPGNVVTDGSRAVLIDLETLREVPGVDAPVRSLEYTPGYAAPEQVSAYEAYLTSDVWSFGALAASMWLDRPPGEAVRALTADAPAARVVEALPPRWLEVLRACLRPVPQSRPRAAAVAAVLRGESAGLDGFMDPPSVGAFGSVVQLPVTTSAPSETTKRVEDPEPDEVSTPSAPAAEPDTPVLPHDIEIQPADRPPLAPEPGRRGGRGLRVALGLGVLLLLAALGLQLDGPAEIASTLMAPPTPPAEPRPGLREALARHKTDADFNGQTEIDRILAEADALVARSRTAEHLGLRALAFVWSQRWHYSTATWDAERWAKADRATEEGLSLGPTVEGRFARAMAMSAACRLMPESAAAVRGERCDAAEALFDQLDHGDDLDRPGWLAVEIHWAAEVLQMHLVLRALRDEDELGIAEHVAIARTHCDAAWPRLHEAPVNGDEMNEDCIAISGWAQDLPGFLAWSDRLLRRRERTSLEGAYPEIAKIFRGGGLPCTYRDVDERGLPTGRARSGSWEHFCDVLGLTALGCVDEPIPRRLLRRAPDVPWAALQRAQRDPPHRACLLGPDEAKIRAKLH